MSPLDSSPVKWTESAWEDLNSIADYLLSEGVVYETANAFLKRIFKAPEHLAAFPGAGKPGRLPGTREWRVKGAPYALIYVMRDSKVHILRVIHDRRRFPE